MTGEAPSWPEARSTHPFFDRRVGPGGDASPGSRGTQSCVGRLLSATEVAELLAVPVTWVREATRAGQLPHVRLGRYIRYERDEVLVWVTQQRSGRARTLAPGPTKAAPR